MSNIEWIAQIIGLVASVIMIGSIQVKDRKTLYLVFSIAFKLLYSINFLLLKAYAGAASAFIGGAITIIAYLYSTKNKTIPKTVAAMFIVISLIGGIYTYKNIYSLMAIATGIIYAILVVSKNMKKIRNLNLAQSILWSIYDIIINAYTAAIASIFTAVSTIIAIIRFDVLDKKGEKVND